MRYPTRAGEREWGQRQRQDWRDEPEERAGRDDESREREWQQGEYPNRARSPEDYGDYRLSGYGNDTRSPGGSEYPPSEGRGLGGGRDRPYEYDQSVGHTRYQHEGQRHYQDPYWQGARHGYGHGRDDGRSRGYAPDAGYGSQSGYGPQDTYAGTSEDLRGGGAGTPYLHPAQRGGQWPHREGGTRTRGRPPKGYTRSDERIREDVCEQLAERQDLDVGEVSIDVKEGEVKIEGTVPERWMKHEIEDIADACLSVKDVDNRLRVKRASDDLSPGAPGQSQVNHRV